MSATLQQSQIDRYLQINSDSKVRNMGRSRLFPMKSIPGTKYSTREDTSPNLDLVHFDHKVTPRSTSFTQFQADGNKLTFQPVVGFIKGYVDDIVLKFTVTNGSDGAFTALPVPFWIKKVSLKANQASKEIWSWYGHTIWQAQAFVSDSRRAIMARQFGSNSTAAINAISIAAGASATYAVRMPFNIFHQLKVNYPSIGQEFQLDVDFQPIVQWMTASANVTLTISNPMLCINSIMIPSRDLEYALLQAKMSPIFQRYLDPMYVPLNNRTWNTGENSIRLEALRGKCAFLTVFARPTVITNNSSGLATYYNFDPDTIYFVDSGGSQELTTKDHTAGFWSRSEEVGQMLDTLFFEQSSVACRIYPFFFSRYPFAALEGNDAGGYTFTGQESIVINAASANSTAHDIIIEAWMYGESVLDEAGKWDTNE